MNDPDELDRLLDNINWPPELRDIFTGDVTVTVSFYGPDDKHEWSDWVEA